MPKGEKRKGGAPSKKTPATLEAALSAAREGLPLRFCAGLAGISYQSLNEYRKSDPDFDQRLETAMSEGVQAKMRKIIEAGNRDTPGAWQALAWSLERAHAHEFSRPEIQLAALTQINQTTVNSLTISVEQADELEKRSKAINAEVDKLVEAYEAKRGQASGTGQDQIREVEATLVSPCDTVITLPPPISRHSNWWAQLSRGDGNRPITPEAAEFIIKAVAADCLGAARAANLKIDLDDPIILSDVWNALSGIGGGWEALCKKCEG